MAQGRSPPPPEIRSPDEGGGAEAETEEEVFDDAFDIPHKNAPHDRLRRWRVRCAIDSFPSILDLRLARWVGDLGCVMRVDSLDLEMVGACTPCSDCLRMTGE